MLFTIIVNTRVTRIACVRRKSIGKFLDKAKLVGSNLCQGKNDEESGGVSYSLFIAPKIKNCLTINEFGIIEELKTFERFIDSKRLLDRSQSLKMIEGKKICVVAKKLEEII